MSSKSNSRTSDGYYNYNPYAPKLNDKDIKSTSQSLGPVSARPVSVSGSQNDKSERLKAHKTRPKFDKISWDGMDLSFAKFKRILEGHLIQFGAVYLLDANFLSEYLI